MFFHGSRSTSRSMWGVKMAVKKKINSSFLVLNVIVVCSDALGMGSRKIPDSSLSASTAGNTGYGPKKARLNTNGN